MFLAIVFQRYSTSDHVRALLHGLFVQPHQVGCAVPGLDDCGDATPAARASTPAPAECPCGISKQTPAVLASAGMMCSYTRQPARKVRFGKYSSCSWSKMGHSFIGLNPKQGIFNARKNRESVAAGKIWVSSFVPQLLATAAINDFQKGFLASSTDVW